MTKYIHEGAIVGMGSLGTALLSRFDKGDVIGVRRTDEDYFQQILESRILLLCMKQGDILAWLDTHSGNLSDEQIVISFGAALSLKTLRKHSNNQVTLVRAMTNRGIARSRQDIIYTSEKPLTTPHLASIQGLFEQIGIAKYVGVSKDEVVDKETHKACDMGRIAFFLEHYQDALIRFLGYSLSEATQSIKQSLRAILDALESGEDLNVIAQRVASRGGITEASITEMSGVSTLMNLGMNAANDKMNELNNKYK